jgi:hypothetical protein
MSITSVIEGRHARHLLLAPLLVATAAGIFPVGVSAAFPKFDYYAHHIVCTVIAPPPASLTINGITLAPNRSMPVDGGTLVAIDVGNNGNIDELCLLASNNAADIAFSYEFPADTGRGGGDARIAAATLTVGDSSGSGGCVPSPWNGGIAGPDYDGLDGVDNNCNGQIDENAGNGN